MKLERIRYEACPLCGNAEFAARGIADCSHHPLYAAPLSSTITWMTCGMCGHVFTSGYWSPDAMSLLCRKTLPHQSVGYNYEPVGRPMAASVIGRVLAASERAPNPFQESLLSWLDVGFGDASLLLTVKEYGINAVGIDIREDNVAAARDIGLEAYCVDIAEFKSAGKFDVVSLCDVLEHVPFPARVLSIVRELMATGGILCVVTPNSDTTVWRLLDLAQANPYWKEIEHYHCFTRERLYTLLQGCGFDPFRYCVSEKYRSGMEVLAMAV